MTLVIKPFSHFQVMGWNVSLNNILNSQKYLTSIKVNTHNGTKLSVRKIEYNDRGFIHEMYMDTTLTLGLKDSFDMYANIMNQKAEKSTHGPELLHISY